MNKQFYTHIIKIESLLTRLDTFSLEETEKSELLSIIDSHIHHTVLDLVLSELSEEEKRIFLTHVVQNNHDAVWELLNTRIDGIEKKIENTIEVLKKELEDDMQNMHSVPSESDN